MTNPSTDLRPPLVVFWAFLMACFACPMASIGQGPPERKLEIQIESEALGQERQVQICLPEGYSPDQRYPVAFVLDSETLLEGFQAAVQFLSQKRVVPEMILVGIPNTQRSLDLTHVADSTTNFQPNGGGDRFEAFITKELIPHLDANYATAPYRLLLGHSISGLFAARVMCGNPSLFKGFILLDPSMWWREMELVGQVAAAFPGDGSGGVFKTVDRPLVSSWTSSKMYLAIANSLPANMADTSAALADTANGSLGFRSVVAFREALGPTRKAGLDWRSKYYTEESHGTLPFIGAYDGLKYLFNFYKKPSFQTLSPESPGILVAHYEQVSQRMGYTILPSAYDLGGLAWRCEELDQNPDLAYAFLELYLKFYPEDPIAHIQMGQHYEIAGDQEKAQEFYQKGIELGYDPSQ